LNILYSNNDSSTPADNSVIGMLLGHIGQERMNKLAQEGLLGQLAKISLRTCEHYLSGKSTRKTFSKSTTASSSLELIHSDICGLMSVRERYGATYFITFIDNYTRYNHIFLISHKSKALDCFRRYLSVVEN